MSLHYAVTFLVLVCLALMAGCGKSEPTDTLSATAVPTETHFFRTTATELPTTAPSPGPTSTPTDTARPANVASPISTASPTLEPSLSSTTAPPQALVDRNGATPAPSASKEYGGLKITVLYDNNAYDARLKTEWGFAALVEYGGHTLLFDTGGDGPTLLDNMAQLDLDPQMIEVVVLSHDHGDHTGGLEGLLNIGVRPTVYVPAAFPSRFKDNVCSRTKLVEVGDSLKILPGMHSTGELGSTIVEQALVVETQAGIVVITGCAHPGIVDMVRQAQNVAEGEIALVLGGFHLEGADPSQLERIVADFRQLGVKRVAPTHCTGEDAIAAFAEAYGADYIRAGVGRVIVVESGSIGNAIEELPGYLPVSH